MQTERYITTIERGNMDLLLVVIPVQGRRTITKTLRRRDPESLDDFLDRVRAWRDRAWRRVHGGDIPSRSFHSRPRPTSVTGVPGVRLLNKVVKSGSRRYVIPCVIAEVHEIAGKDYARPRGSRSRLFSLNVYAFDEAVALAAAWRSEQIRRLEA